MPNYHLTFSVSERKASEVEALRSLSNGHNVAIVFATPKHNLPATWHGYNVIDGDLSDDRTADPRGGTVVGLAYDSDEERSSGTIEQYLAYRTADPRGVVVGLAAKAGARGDKTGFVKAGHAS